MLLLLLFSSKRYQEMKAIASGFVYWMYIHRPPTPFPTLHPIRHSNTALNCFCRLSSSLKSQQQQIIKINYSTAFRANFNCIIRRSIRRSRIINKDTTRTRISHPLVQSWSLFIKFVEQKKGGKEERMLLLLLLFKSIGALGCC